MKERANIPPPPCGAGAGGGGREDLGAAADPRLSAPIVPKTERSIGWGPQPSQTRQREFSRANARAKRLRKEMTPAEKALWKLLRDIPDTHFRKQVAIDNRVFDFGEFGHRLLIELDGAVHERAEVAFDDKEKETRAKEAGFKILRLKNADVEARTQWVLDQVRIFLKAPHPLPPPRQGAGEESES